MSRFKAKILRVGRVIQHTDGVLEPVGFCFDGCGKTPILEFAEDGIYYAGWSAKELAEVAARPSEFVEMEMP